MADTVGVPATVLLPAVAAMTADATRLAVLPLPQGNGLVNRQTQILQEQRQLNLKQKAKRINTKKNKKHEDDKDLNHLQWLSLGMQVNTK